jgi:hypothetical protein
MLVRLRVTVLIIVSVFVNIEYIIYKSQLEI